MDALYGDALKARRTRPGKKVVKRTLIIHNFNRKYCVGNNLLIPEIRQIQVKWYIE